jgi:hypothetical protein
MSNCKEHSLTRVSFSFLFYILELFQHSDFLLGPSIFSRTMALGSTQPPTEMSARRRSGGKTGRRVGLTTLPPSISRMSENVGASTSCNPKGLHGLYRDNFTLYIYISSFSVAA